MSRVDSALFPMYRDPSTLSSFLSSAKQFSCAQICEDDFKAQRINIILLLALFGRELPHMKKFAANYYSKSQRIASHMEAPIVCCADPIHTMYF